MTSMIIHTDCCIVGSGPTGVILAFLLARQGVSVVLLEAHKNFDHDWRGDTIHPLTLELMEALGLVDRLLEMAYKRIESSGHASTWSLCKRVLLQIP